MPGLPRSISLQGKKKSRPNCLTASAIIIVFASQMIMLHWLTTQSSGVRRKSNFDLEVEDKSDPLKRPGFDCAINSVRVPKTASTTVYEVFTQPLLDSKLFQSTHLMPNTCLLRPSGCSIYWNDTMAALTSAVDNTTPYFGIGPRTDLRNIENTTNNFKRCFPQEKIFCFEYDQGTNTMKFGPHSKTHWFVKNNFDWDEGEGTFYKIFANHFFITAIVTGHIGLDTSLFGWLLPPNPMVFIVFRDPVKRLLSSFHYGIPMGADRPGQVRMCKDIGDQTKWRERVSEVRKLATISNDTSAYQMMLRQYLETCPDASQNAYTRFLDPLTKKLQVALNHLESHVIVGLYSNVQETLKRWINIALDVCNEHPEYSKMKRTLVDSFEKRGGEMTRLNAKIKDSVVLLSPDISQFDKELQYLIREYTKEDEAIFKRARELYDKQRHWGYRGPL